MNDQCCLKVCDDSRVSKVKQTSDNDGIRPAVLMYVILCINTKDCGMY